MSLNNLLLTNLGIIFFYIYYSRAFRTKFKIDHLALMAIGIVYYWLMPLYAYEYNLFIGHHSELYNEVSLINKKLYLSYVLIIIFSMLLGDWVSKGLTSRFSFQKFYYSKNILDFFYWIFLGLGFFTAYYMRNVFFTSYETVNLWPYERGWFISVCASLTTLNIIHSSTHVIFPRSPKRKFDTIRIFVFNKYFISAFLFNFLMLTTGNRGYFMAFVVSIILIHSEKNNGFKLIKIVLLMFFILIINGSVALIRSDQEFSIAGNIGNFVYESVNVGITLLYHIKDMDYNLMEVPDVLFSKLIGIIPSIVFPGKFALMVSPEEVGKSVIPYQASTHNYVELMINFGLIGTIFLFFFFSIGFNWLKSKKHYTPIYIGVCSQIPFFFFRSFYDATVKYIFEFSILLPLLILSISYVYRKHLT